MRIAIVNDSAIAVEALRRMVTSVPNYSVAWIARDGAQGVAEAARDRPELILMDLHMPNMDGVEAIRRIMDATPCPILVVTATIQGHAAKVFEALAAGALDAVATPVFTGDGEADTKERFIAKLRTIERIVGKRPRRVSTTVPAVTTPRPFTRPGEKSPLVVIGASAGGPGAIAEVLKHLPLPFPPIIVVQHIDAQFAGGMADWLNGQTELEVRLAKPQDILHPGTVYVAGQEGHLILSDSRHLDYTAQPIHSAYMPSIDTCFASVAENWNGRVAAVLLTGMGRDGAEGLKMIREAGGFTVAQDKETSIVYGMPKAALELNAAVEIMPLTQIAQALVKFCDRLVRNV